MVHRLDLGAGESILCVIVISCFVTYFKMHQEFLYSEKSFKDVVWIHICYSQYVSFVNSPFQLVGEPWA